MALNSALGWLDDRKYQTAKLTFISSGCFRFSQHLCGLAAWITVCQSCTRKSVIRRSFILYHRFLTFSLSVLSVLFTATFECFLKLTRFFWKSSVDQRHPLSHLSLRTKNIKALPNPSYSILELAPSLAVQLLLAPYLCITLSLHGLWVLCSTSQLHSYYLKMCLKSIHKTGRGSYTLPFLVKSFLKTNQGHTATQGKPHTI